MPAIKTIYAKKKLDMIGTPSLEVTIELESGHIGVAFAPLTLDLNKAITKNEDILNDVDSVNKVIFKVLKGKDALDQQGLDKTMLSIIDERDGTKLGKNAIIAVSIAIAKAAASYCNLPLYRYIGGVNVKLFPMPLSTVLRGGGSCNNKVNIKEFILVPVGFVTFKDSLYGSLKVFNKMGELVEECGQSTNIQNGYVSNLDGDEEAIELICEAISACGYNLGDDFFIGLNVGASEWEMKYNKYKMPKKNQLLTSAQVGDYLFDLCQKYPIIFLEDPLNSRDFSGYMKLKNRISDVQIVETSHFEDLLKKMQTSFYNDSTRAVIVSLKDIRTLTELMDLIEMARQASYTVIMSDRSLNRENSLMADIILGLGIAQVKIGTPMVADRVCKCKRFLELEEIFQRRLRNVSSWRY